MNNILTPEESAQFVTYGDLMKIMEELGKAMQQLEEYRDKDMTEVLGKVLDTIADVEYKRIRDVRFFLSLLNDLGYGPKDKLHSHYGKWCEEYDKLNKGEKHEG